MQDEVDTDCSLMIVNRQSLSDFILPIEVNIQISRDANNKQIMFVKKDDGIDINSAPPIQSLIYRHDQ